MEAIKDLKKATVKWRKTRDAYLDLSTSTPKTNGFKTKLPGQGFSLEEYLPSTPEAVDLITSATRQTQVKQCGLTFALG